MSNEGDRSGTPRDRRRITLYGPTRIPFTEKVRRALLYKGLEFDLLEPSGPEDYRRWNPKTGLLPVLEIDGELYPDSTDILFKLDELFPEEHYQLTHNALFTHECMHAENLGGDIGAPELQNRRLTIGVFPWKFKGGEAAFCRVIAFVEA